MLGSSIHPTKPDISHVDLCFISVVHCLSSLIIKHKISLKLNTDKDIMYKKCLLTFYPPPLIHIFFCNVTFVRFFSTRQKGHPSSTFQNTPPNPGGLWAQCSSWTQSLQQRQQSGNTFHRNTILGYLPHPGCNCHQQTLNTFVGNLNLKLHFPPLHPGWGVDPNNKFCRGEKFLPTGSMALEHVPTSHFYTLLLLINSPALPAIMVDFFNHAVH